MFETKNNFFTSKFKHASDCSLIQKQHENYDFHFFSMCIKCCEGAVLGCSPHSDITAWMTTDNKKKLDSQKSKGLTRT